MSVLLVNPNASDDVTGAMVRAAATVLGTVEGLTCTGAPPMLTTPDQLEQAARQVAALAIPGRCRGIIVAAFGDPGRDALAARLDVPVIGIGGAAARAAGRDDAPFAVATTTSLLRAEIDALMARAPGQYVGSFCTAGDPLALVANPSALDHALLDAVERAAQAGARRVIIGGGPLADAALRLKQKSPVPLVHPVLEAAREMAARLECDNERGFCAGPD